MNANRQYVVAHDESGPITQAMHEASDAAGGPVLQPDPSQIGPTSGVVADSAPPHQDPDDVDDVDTSEVPTAAAEVVAWIRAAGDDQEASRRAGLAWAVESQRPDGARTTVESEVDQHLELESPSGS